MSSSRNLKLLLLLLLVPLGLGFYLLAGMGKTRVPQALPSARPSPAKGKKPSPAVKAKDMGTPSLPRVPLPARKEGPSSKRILSIRGWVRNKKGEGLRALLAAFLPQKAGSGAPTPGPASRAGTRKKNGSMQGSQVSPKKFIGDTCTIRDIPPGFLIRFALTKGEDDDKPFKATKLLWTSEGGALDFFLE